MDQMMAVLKEHPEYREKAADFLPFLHAVELEKAAINGNFSEIFPHIVFVSGYAVLVAACSVILFLKQMKNQ